MRALLRADFARLADLTNAPGERSAAWTPAHVCVALYRLTQFFQRSGHRLLARFCWQLNQFLTAADLSPAAEIGPGLVVLHPAAVMVAGKAGCNLTIVGRGGFGGGLSLADVGAGPGFAVVGDDVTLEMGAMILGPQLIGNRVRIGPNCTVIQHLPDDALVLPLEARVRGGRQPEGS